MKVSKSLVNVVNVYFHVKHLHSSYPRRQERAVFCFSISKTVENP